MVIIIDELFGPIPIFSCMIYDIQDQKKKKRKKRTKHLKRSDRLFNFPSQPIGPKKFVLFLNYGGTNHPEELYITGHGIHSDHCVNHCYQESPNKCTQDHRLQARQSKEPTQMHAGQSGRRSLVRFSPRVCRYTLVGVRFDSIARTSPV